MVRRNLFECFVIKFLSLFIIISFLFVGILIIFILRLFFNVRRLIKYDGFFIKIIFLGWKRICFRRLSFCEVSVFIYRFS